MADPGLRRPRALVLRAFARLPRAGRLWLVRIASPAYTVGALCLVEHEGRFLMLRQLHRRGWTLPGGLLARGESPDQAVARELAEETGLHAEPGWPVATVVEPRARRVDVLFHVVVEQRPAAQPRGEAVQAAWLTIAEAGTMDRPTAHALATLERVRSTVVRPGRLVDSQSTQEPRQQPTPSPTQPPTPSPTQPPGRGAAAGQ